MKALNMIRSTLAASLCLSVIVACDGRGVVQMKAHQYTAGERAQSRQLLGQKGDESQTLVSRLYKERHPKAKIDQTVPGKPFAEGADEPEIKPDDKAVAKSFWEKMDATGTEVSTNVANLRALVAEKLAKGFDSKVAKRFAGISVENKSQFGSTVFDLHAIITLRGRDQALHLNNQVLSPADAKDLVYGTSKVEVNNFNASNVAEKNITTDELLVSSFCLEPDGKACKHAYLTIQLGRDESGEWITAVFELDAQLTIANSNIRERGQREMSYYEALERISKLTQDDLSKHDNPSAHLESIKRENAIGPAAAVLRDGNLKAETRTNLADLSRNKNEPVQFKTVEPRKVIGPVNTAMIKPAAPAALKIEDKVPANSPVKVGAKPTGTKNDLLAISKGATAQKAGAAAAFVPKTPVTDLSNSSKVIAPEKTAPKGEASSEAKPARKNFISYLWDAFKFE